MASYKASLFYKEGGSLEEYYKQSFGTQDVEDHTDEVVCLGDGVES